MQKGWIKLIIALDIIWVVESLIIVVPQLFGLSFLGYFLIGAVAGWVALMAFLQARGLKQYLVECRAGSLSEDRKYSHENQDTRTTIIGLIRVFFTFVLISFNH